MSKRHTSGYHRAMRMIFSLPAPWESSPSGRLVVWKHPDTNIQIEVDPVGPLPDDRKAWGERVLYRNMPEGGSLEQTEILNSTNHQAWPVTIVSTLIRNKDKDGAEVRVSMFYEFVYFGGVVVCRIAGDAVERYESEFRQPILDAMMSVAPEMRDAKVANIDELWDMSVSAS